MMMKIENAEYRKSASLQEIAINLRILIDSTQHNASRWTKAHRFIEYGFGINKLLQICRIRYFSLQQAVKFLAQLSEYVWMPG